MTNSESREVGRPESSGPEEIDTMAERVKELEQALEDIIMCHIKNRLDLNVSDQMDDIARAALGRQVR